MSAIDLASRQRELAGASLQTLGYRRGLRGRSTIGLTPDARRAQLLPLLREISIREVEQSIPVRLAQFVLCVAMVLDEVADVWAG
jgi:hypothetical protein